MESRVANLSKSIFPDKPKTIVIKSSSEAKNDSFGTAGEIAFPEAEDFTDSEAESEKCN